MRGGSKSALPDKNNTSTVQGNGGGELCPHASTIIIPVQYKEMGGGGGYAHTPRHNTCTVQTFTNPVEARVKHDIDL